MASVRTDEETIEFDELFRRDYLSVVRAVAPIVGGAEHAEAIAQDAFLAALRRWRRLRRYEALDVDTAIRSLPARQRAAISLYYLADWPTEDIADALGCAPAKVRVHLHRARSALAALLDVDADREEIP